MPDCYVEHMKELFEKGCTKPWSQYFTTDGKNCTERGRQHADGVNGTSDDDMQDYFEGRFKSYWLLNNPESPCAGKSMCHID